MNRWTFLAGMVTVLSLAACEDAHDEHAHESPEAEACEHLADGPAISVVAGATQSEALPNTAVEHTRIDVGLVAVDASQGGFVAWEADAAGAVSFYLDADIPLVVSTATGEAVAVTRVAGSEVCAEIAVRYDATLDVGTYTLAFGPTERDTVRFVAEYVVE